MSSSAIGYIQVSGHFESDHDFHANGNLHLIR